MEDGEREMVGAGGAVTFKVALPKEHPVLPLDAVQLKPEIWTEPTATPLTVLGLVIEATLLLLELKFPPVQPEGALATVLWPELMEEEPKVTVPAGQVKA
jgi:hypothetical protein